MARPQKNGLDYMSLDIDVFTSRTFRFISGRYQSRGLIIIIKLLTELYRKGYYLPWDDISKLLFVESLPGDCDETLVNAVVADLLQVEFFDNSLYESDSILTSCRIQERYFTAKEKKSFNYDDLKYILTKGKKDNISSESTQVISEKTTVISEKTPPKRKEKKIKEYIPPIVPPLRGDDEDFIKTKELEAYNIAINDKENYNYDGLVSRLNHLGIISSEQSQIIYLSQYGKIGGDVWRIIPDVEKRKSSITKPGQYIIKCLRELQS